MFNLKNKVALITGGAKGIGKGIAKVLSQAGCNVVIGDIDSENGEKTAKELNGYYVYLDVASKASCEKAVREIIERFEKIDILCSNAGIYPQKRIEEMGEEDWDRVHNVNLKGTFFIIQAVIPFMKKQNYGRIIITSSITGPITGFPGWAHYGATKAGQLGFMRSAALELAKYNITVNAVLPGNILTEGLIEQGEEYLNKMKKAIPLHRLGNPEDIGYAVLFFASDEAGYITGQTLVIDGGQILPESLEAIE